MKVSTIFLRTFVLHAAWHVYAKDLMDRRIDKISDMLFGRVFEVMQMGQNSMDQTTLGKPGNALLPLQGGSSVRALGHLSSPHLGGQLRPIPNMAVHAPWRVGPAKVAQVAVDETRVPLPKARTGGKSSTPEVNWNKPLKALQSMQDQEGHVEEVHSQEDLDNCLKQSHEVAVLEIVATYCRPCKSFAPKYQRVAADPDYVGKVSFSKLVLNESNETWKLVKQRFPQTKTTPALYAFRHGELVAQLQGVNEKKLRNTLEELLFPMGRPPSDQKSPAQLSLPASQAASTLVSTQRRWPATQPDIRNHSEYMLETR
jgi:thiol-disulfide isomerase/thioredoxin